MFVLWFQSVVSLTGRMVRYKPCVLQLEDSQQGCEGVYSLLLFVSTSPATVDAMKGEMKTEM